MKQNDTLDDFVSFIKGWNQIKVDPDTLKKWSQIKVTKQDIKKVLSR